MDKGIQDSYSLFIPIEDDHLMKSISVDENGDYIVQGVMSSDATDEEDDSISPEGMDCSYFLEKGWVKYEHGNNPEQFIGEPLEVKVGRFDHPTLLKSVNGVYVKARLFAQRRFTKSAIETMEDLQKSNTKRRMGWSIEGGVVERDKETGKIIKSIIRNVVLTMNPVNTSTWAELAKSFAKNHALIVDMPIDKSMDTEAITAVTPQSLEGSKTKKKDEQQEWIDLFRSTVRKALLEKSFRSLFLTSPEHAEIIAFDSALKKGLGYEGADEFGTYISEKHTVLKSIITGAINSGGESMKTLGQLLDADLDELKKSIELASEEDEQEELSKSMGEGGDDDDDHQEPDGDEGEGEEGDNDGDEGDDDDDMEKSFNTELTKSLAGQHQQAFDVSDFLSDLTEEIGFSLQGMEKSLMATTKQQNAIVKALGGFGDVLQKALTKIEDMEAENAELTKSLNLVLDRPMGRRSVVNQREVQTLSKSMGQTGAPRLSRTQIVDELVKSFEAGKIPGSTVSRFEAGVPLDRLNLPEDVQEKIGFNQ